MRQSVVSAVGLVTLTLLGVGWAHPGHAASSVVCGQTLTADTTLTENLKGCPDFGLKMAAPITLDLNGHTISAAGWGVIASGGTIKNGSIVGSRGITDNGHGAAGPLTITHVRLRGGTLALDEAADSVIDGSVIDHGQGITLESSGRVTIMNSGVLDNNGFCGISVHESGAGRFENNYVARNAGGGICTTGSVSTFIGNKVIRNHGDGISIFDREDTQGDTFGNNTASHNDDLGISMFNESIATGQQIPAIDLGGNVARHNGDPRECVALGLTCNQ